MWIYASNIDLASYGLKELCANVIANVEVEWYVVDTTVWHTLIMKFSACMRVVLHAITLPVVRKLILPSKPLQLKAICKYILYSFFVSWCNCNMNYCELLCNCVCMCQVCKNCSHAAHWICMQADRILTGVSQKKINVYPSNKLGETDPPIGQLRADNLWGSSGYSPIICSRHLAWLAGL